MGISGIDNQVFIIRIRAVPREMPGVDPVWRGEIEQLSTGRKAFLKNLKEIILFIQPVLEEMGVESTGPPLTLREWRKRVWSFLTALFRHAKL